MRHPPIAGGGAAIPHGKTATIAIKGIGPLTSGPQKGERGVDGHQKTKGLKRHILTCSLGFVLVVLVMAAKGHDTQAMETLLARAAEDGWAPQRDKVDGNHTGARMGAAAQRHGVDVQVSTRDPGAEGFTPLPIRWRNEATFGTQTNDYRRLTRNWERDAAAAEDAVHIASAHRILRAYVRETTLPP